MNRFSRRAVFTGVALCLSGSEAWSHASERGYVLLLPTDYYLFGGMLAVALSFLVLVFLPVRIVEWLMARRISLFPMPLDGRVLTSTLSFFALAGIVYAGFQGSRDPLSNPLPLVIWTLLWVGVTVAQGVFGNVWAWINPWYGPWRFLVGAGVPENGFRRLPAVLDRWPAFLIFFGFAWFELVYLAPADPERLAVAVSFYWVFTCAGMVVFGHEPWSRRVEFLTLFFGMVSRLSFFALGEEGGRRKLLLGLPGYKLDGAIALSTSGVAFLLLALSSVSFDGLKHTFFWLDLIGINPLEFPGRSAVVGASSLGLVVMFGLLFSGFMGAVWLGCRLAGEDGWLKLAGHLAWSIIPIALAYHFSHYLVGFTINSQYALAALSDPLMRGWNLFGTAGMHVQAGATLGAQSAWIIWNAQAIAIIGGHVLAVVLSHLIAYRHFGSAQRATMSQIPLAALMVGYTVFGLWLLSAPTAG
ncbi:hypothetical protein ACFPOD_14075 [Nitratireductor kimnyeongensis]|uniref:Uncharacterized protein n=1 Tax=Nitratireductor kimnyeongensis TaxID=430679 RepID=A0ABW0T9Y9_9HYPH|nr:hypothetical protein [Nitratireductor kimnyeongensis]QZZ36542.1 hypothetical protein KW403_05220 [Nitratireductor kimnyeongensis]